MRFPQELDQVPEVWWHGDGVKRGLDVGLAVLGLVLSSPLWALIALAIKLEDRGPIFYRQDRACALSSSLRMSHARRLRKSVTRAPKASAPKRFITTAISVIWS